MKLPFCIISRSFRPSPRNPLPPRLEKGFVSPGNGIIWFGLPSSEGLFQTAVRRSCLPAGRVCSKLHASLCGFPNGPSQSPFTAVRTFSAHIFQRLPPNVPLDGGAGVQTRVPRSRLADYGAYAPSLRRSTACSPKPKAACFRFH